ncbi:hypothetical protein I6F33_08020 [Bradyrhizobium sp. BRP20]|uniref:hypothetical protein n=1 Tax=Bradyrhizobium sp. BRP20 TaxID=2793822 RepID=UPI001CD2E1DA|nr:hypothetical protein [Bradyrhizobium sp. BRP20]MCA1432923.1 hypothetical protein [Bradyrhizobium sp. BRP20]
MPVYDLYSKRKARESRSQPDVYKYDHIPYGLKIQIKHIWDDAIGVPYHTRGRRGDDQIFQCYLRYRSGPTPRIQRHGH